VKQKKLTSPSPSPPPGETNKPEETKKLTSPSPGPTPEKSKQGNPPPSPAPGLAPGPTPKEGDGKSKPTGDEVVPYPGTVLLYGHHKLAHSAVFMGGNIMSWVSKFGKDALYAHEIAHFTGGSYGDPLYVICAKEVKITQPVLDDDELTKFKVVPKSGTKPKAKSKTEPKDKPTKESQTGLTIKESKSEPQPKNKPNPQKKGIQTGS